MPIERSSFCVRAGMTVARARRCLAAATRWIRIERVGSALAVVIMLTRLPATSGAMESSAAAESTIHLDGKHPIVTAECFGKRLRFLVNSTCPTTIFDVTWRPQLGDRVKLTEVPVADGTSYDMECFEAPPIKIDSCIPLLREVGIVNLSRINSEVEPPVDGLIGMDVLSQFVVILDCDAGTMKLRKSLPRETGDQLPLELTPGRPPTLPICIGNNRVAPFAICTDALFAVQLSRARFAALRNKGEIRSTNATIAVGELTTQSAKGIAQELAISSHVNRSVAVAAGPIDAVGVYFLSRYVVTLDFPNQKAYVKPAKCFSRLDRLDQSGIWLIRRDGQTVIYWVAPDSPAWDCGLLIGDVLVSVDERPADQFTLIQLRSLFQAAAAPISIAATRNDKQIKFRFVPKNYLQLDDDIDSSRGQNQARIGAVGPVAIAKVTVAKHGEPLVVPVQADGFERPLRMLVDTGASQTIFSNRFREQLGTRVGWAAMQTPDGPLMVEQFRIGGAALGKVRLGDARIAVADDSQIELFRRFFGIDDLDGVLGMDLMRGHVVQIDFDAGEFRLLSEAGADCGVAIEFRYRPSGTPALKTIISGSEERWFMIDSGCACENWCDEDLFNALESANAINSVQAARKFDHSRAFIRKRWRVNSLEIGPFRQQNVEFSLAKANCIGLTYLSRYGVVTFDFPRRTLYLKPDAADSPLERYERSGMQLLKRQKEYVVVDVAPRSPANEAGIIAGDVLLALNGTDATEYSLFQVRQLLSAPAESAAVVVRRMDERIEVKIALRDYFVERTPRVRKRIRPRTVVPLGK